MMAELPPAVLPAALITLIERALQIAERLTVAVESIAASLQESTTPPEYVVDDTDADANRDDVLDPEIVATIETLEDQGIRVPDEVYRNFKLEPPDRTLPPELDAGLFDLPQSALIKMQDQHEPPAPPEPTEPAELLDPDSPDYTNPDHPDHPVISRKPGL